MYRYLIILALLLPLPAAAGETIRIAVATNFRATLEQINALYQQNTGEQILLSSASTGTLYSQISHGAPFDLFFAADQQAPAMLSGSTSSKPFCYAIGRLALVGSDDIEADLADPDLSLAIANPAIAPYGLAAEQVLQRPEFAGAKQRKLLRGNSVVQAYQFWHSGGADLALVALAIAPQGRVIPKEWHRPLEQHLLVLPRGENRPEVDAYLNWIRSDTVRAMISNAGYEPCP